MTARNASTGRFAPRDLSFRTPRQATGHASPATVRMALHATGKATGRALGHGARFSALLIASALGGFIGGMATAIVLALSFAATWPGVT